MTISKWLTAGYKRTKTLKFTCSFLGASAYPPFSSPPPKGVSNRCGRFREDGERPFSLVGCDSRIPDTPEGDSKIANRLGREQDWQ